MTDHDEDDTPTSRASPAERAALGRLLAAAWDFSRYGIAYAKQDDPHLLAVVGRKLGAGAKLVMVVDFEEGSVSMQMRGEMEDGTTETVEVYKYTPNATPVAASGAIN